MTGRQAIDLNPNTARGRNASARYQQIITPDDDDELEYVGRAFQIGSAGSIHYVTSGGSEIEAPEGMFLPGVLYSIELRKIFATGTTAGDILVSW